LKINEVLEEATVTQPV